MMLKGGGQIRLASRHSCQLREQSSSIAPLREVPPASRGELCIGSVPPAHRGNLQEGVKKQTLLTQLVSEQAKLLLLTGWGDRGLLLALLLFEFDHAGTSRFEILHQQGIGSVKGGTRLAQDVGRDGAWQSRQVPSVRRTTARAPV
jgi:hypothetical protein